MKKLTLIISALALVLGMSQCKKPNYPSNIMTGSHKSDVTFTVGGDQKGSFDHITTTSIGYKWSSSDVLHVYGMKKEGESITGVGYAGVIRAMEIDGFNATFNGIVNIPEGSNALRFIHYGSGVTVNNDGSAVSDLSLQDGLINGTISKKIVALCDKEIVDVEALHQEYDDCELQSQYAALKLDLTSFETDNVYLTCIEQNGLKVNEKGEVEKVNGLFSELQNVTSEYYVAVMPIEKGLPFNFSNNAKNGVLEINNNDITDGIFYSSNGNSYVVSSETLTEGILPGIFTTAKRKAVRFTQGNLQYLGQATENKWRFADNQWDFMGNGPVGDPRGDVDGPGNVRFGDEYIGKYNYASGLATPTEDDMASARDLFGWGTSGISGSAGVATNFQPYCTSTSPEPYWAYNNVDANLEDNGGYADWGHNTINGKNDWRTLKAVEYTHFLDINNDGRKVVDENHNYVKPFGFGKVKGVDGMIVLPDTWNGKVNGNTVSFTYGISSFVNQFNETTTPKWSEMENAGVVFLPNAGVRFYIKISEDPLVTHNCVLHFTNGYYWSSTAGGNCGTTEGVGNQGAGRLNFCWEGSDGKLYCPYPYYRHMGYSVRLVSDLGN